MVPYDAAQELYIERNVINPQFCPVAALLFWLRESSLEYGPIFPAQNNQHTALLVGTHFGCNTYQRWLREVYKYTGGDLAECSSHSVRKSSASWAARCGKGEAEVQRVGRWALNSTSFRLYIEHGVALSARHLGRLRQTADPVFKFWKFATSVVQTS